MIQIAFAYSEASERELKKMGFIKQEAYIKHCSSNKGKGEAEFWKMAYKPFQFLVSNYWGAGPD